jgi:hypothetical protein
MGGSVLLGAVDNLAAHIFIHRTAAQIDFVSRSSAASGPMGSTWPLTMPTLLNRQLVASLEKLSHSSGEPADSLRSGLDATMQA